MTEDCRDEKFLAEWITRPLVDHAGASGRTGFTEVVHNTLTTLNVMDNLMRGTLAEAIVATAIGGELTTEWDAWDINLPLPDDRTVKIEVKCSGDFQSWPQKASSVIKWDIAKRRWTTKPDTGEIVELDKAQRMPDLWVFARHLCTEPHHLDHWRFWVLTTRQLDTTLGDQKSITLSSLLHSFPDLPQDGCRESEIRTVVLKACVRPEQGD